MKKIFLFLLPLLVLSAFLYRSSEHRSVPDEPRRFVTVLSTTRMIHDIVSEVGGDRVSSNLLIRGGIDPHTYELVKGDDEKIDSADVVFFNGLQLEHGAGLSRKLSSHPLSVSVGDYVLALDPERILSERGQPDPHIWMDVSLWAEIVDPIVETLALKDREGGEYYRQRGEALKKKLLLFHEECKERVRTVPEEKRYLVTSHDAFAYFARVYLAEEGEAEEGTWRKRIAAPEGFAPDGQVGLLHLRSVIEYLLKHNVRVLFPESNVARDSLGKILFACREKGISVRFSNLPLHGDSMGDADSYLAMIEHNISVLLKEWGSGNER